MTALIETLAVALVGFFLGALKGARQNPQSPVLVKQVGLVKALKRIRR